MGVPHDSCVVRSSSWDVASALRAGPKASAEGQHMDICRALPCAVGASKDDERVCVVPDSCVAMPGMGLYL